MGEGGGGLIRKCNKNWRKENRKDRMQKIGYIERMKERTHSTTDIGLDTKRIKKARPKQPNKEDRRKEIKCTRTWVIERCVSNNYSVTYIIL